MKEKIFNIIKSKFFRKLFCILYGINLLLLVIEMITDTTYLDSLTWSGFFVVNIVMLVIWFIISYVLSFLFQIIKNKYSDKELIKQKMLEDKNANLVIKCFRRAKFSFIMSIICFIIGILFIILSRYDTLKIRLSIILIGYIPCILFVIITLMRTKFYKKIKVRIFCGVMEWLLIFFIFVYYLMAIVSCAFLEAMNPITDIKNYNGIVKDDRLLKVFPAEIPNNIKNINFYYAPGILQGGTEYSLYFIDEKMTKEKFDKKYKSKALWIGRKKEYNEKGGLLAGAFSFTPAENKNEDDYIIYLIEGKCDDSGYCNHGSLLLTAYNEKTNEIIYKSEQW